MIHTCDNHKSDKPCLACEHELASNPWTLSHLARIQGISAKDIRELEKAGFEFVNTGGGCMNWRADVCERVTRTQGVITIGDPRSGPLHPDSRGVAFEFVVDDDVQLTGIYQTVESMIQCIQMMYEVQDG